MSEWTARVEWTTPDPYDVGAMALVTEHLAEHSGAVVRETAPPGVGETWSAFITVEANTLRQAIAAALEVVEGATGERAAGVEVVDADVHAFRVEQHSIPELVGHAEIADMLGVSRQRALQLAARPDFPVAVVETKAGPLRVKRQVEGWAATWERRNGRPPKAAAAKD